MAKNFYLPGGDKERSIWLNNFAAKFAANATILGFTAADVTSVNNDAAAFAYAVNQIENLTAAKERRVEYKNLLRNGPVSTVPLPAPPAPNTGTAPTPVPPGAFFRNSQWVQRIKNSPAYTNDMGKDFGIIGGEDTGLNEQEMKPILKLVRKGRDIEVQWKKGGADSLHIETDKGAGWQFLAVDSVPHYTDTTPVTAAATWKYRAMYIVNDELVGQWSDVGSITVG